jgi:hypothetical protein
MREAIKMQWTGTIKVTGTFLQLFIANAANMQRLLLKGEAKILYHWR